MKTLIVAASAGTGKTFRLAEALKNALVGDEAIEPERVVAVTYTRTAAAELEARVRRALLEAGHPQLARRLGAARIGTVHSVCARLVADHALELGLSPELETIDERRALQALLDAVEQEVTDAERGSLERLQENFGGFDWKKAVKEIIDRTRLNNMAADDLARCADRSASGLLALLPSAEKAGVLEARLMPVLERILSSSVRNDLTPEHRRHAEEMALTLRGGEQVPWQIWESLSRTKQPELAGLCAEHLRHPSLRADIVLAIELVFSIAARAMQRYAEEKRRWAVFDFADQETLALALLKDPAVRPRIAESVGIVLVDEFQDTSPMQLAVLSELTGIAGKSLFVGDQKQAIFGFRGADPELMQRLMDALPTTVETLRVSHRSRPGLVTLTNELFAPAFARHGLADELVRVQAVVDEEPDGLGPYVERWTLSRSRHGHAREIAAGVAELLEDGSVLVRENGDLVPLQRRHVAVLVRTHDHGEDIAAELAALDVPAVRRRSGLCKTLEARLLMSGLALFLDGRDALAAAELARLRNTEAPDAWLTRLVQSAPGQAFLDDPYVQGVIHAGVAHRDAGVVAAVDLVVESLRARDVCAAWGDAPQRLANLGAFRALATRFVHARSAMGAGATIAGFLARLEELAALEPREEDADDEQGEVTGLNAVHILTWHGAKGLEWPVVVLAQLTYQRGPSAFGVHVESDVLAVDPREPLLGRWVRYWPGIYGRKAEGGLRSVVARHDLQRALDERADREELRLLYVGWTRARDRLVIPGPSGDGHETFDLWRGARSILRHLSDAAGVQLVREPSTDGRARWAGVDVQTRLRTPMRRASRPSSGDVRSSYAPLPRAAYAPATLQPSAMQETGVAGEPITLGPPILPRTSADNEVMARLGSALHGFLAADGGSDVRRFRLAGELLARFEVQHLLAPEDIVIIGDRLEHALEAHYPGARRRREAPVVHRLAQGTVVRGIIDLVLELDAGFIVVDHKTYVTSEPRALAATFAGQLRAYADALAAATGRPVMATLIHLPLSGALVHVVPQPLQS